MGLENVSLVNIKLCLKKAGVQLDCCIFTKFWSGSVIFWTTEQNQNFFFFKFLFCIMKGTFNVAVLHETHFLDMHEGVVFFFSLTHKTQVIYSSMTDHPRGHCNMLSWLLCVHLSLQQSFPEQKRLTWVLKIHFLKYSEEKTPINLNLWT